MEVVRGTRFRILRLLGKGGMGEVYLAFDNRLRRKVALKCIDPLRQGDEELKKRLKREAEALAALAHPGLVVMFESVDFAADPIVLGEGIPGFSTGFGIVMEYVEGETLRHRLDRGPMAIDEVIRVFQQVLEALAVAHRAHFVHRDLKPSNLMLTAGGGVKILDFGLVKILGNEHSSLTQDDARLGTYEYMSPEQALGETIDQRSDLFSLGVVLYEALSGISPFRRDSPRETFSAVINHAPSPVSAERPEVRGELSQLIDRLLAKNPAWRPPHAMAVVDELKQAVSAPRHFLAQHLGSILRWIAIVGLLLLLVASALHFGTCPPPVVAVVVTQNAVEGSGEKEAWRTVVLEEVLGGFFAAGDHVRTIAREQVQTMWKDLGKGPGADLTVSEITRWCRYLGADKLVFASYEVRSGEEQPMVDLKLRLFDLDGRQLASGAATRPRVLELIQPAATPLVARLRDSVLSSNERLEFFGLLPQKAEAVRLYGLGLEARREQALDRARVHLQAAFEHENTHPGILVELAEVLGLLGETSEAQSVAAEAVTQGIGRAGGYAKRLLARAHMAAGDLKAMRRVYEGRLEEHPTEFRTALAYADHLFRAGEPIEALVVLERLESAGGKGLCFLPQDRRQRRDPRLQTDPRIGLLRVKIHQRHGEFPELRQAAQQAAERAEAAGMRGAQAQALLALSAAQQVLGKPDAAEDALLQALDLYEEAEDRLGTVRSYLRMGILVRGQGELNSARLMFRLAASRLEVLGEDLMLAKTLNNLGYIHADLGEFTMASEQFQQALAIFQRLDSPSDTAFSLINLGVLWHEEGSLQRARSYYEQALALAGQAKNQRAIATSLTNLGELDYLAGDLVQSEEYHQQSLALNRRYEDQPGMAYDSLRLGLVSAARGDLPEARRWLRTSRENAVQSGDPWTAALVDVTLARLDLESGDLQVGLGRALSATRVFETEGGLEQVSALAVLAELQDALHKGEEALATLARGRKAAAKGSKEGILRIRLSAARLLAVDHPEAARQDLMVLLAEAEAASFIPYVLEARYALAEVELIAGGLDRGREQLIRCVAEASAAGFGDLARRAQERIQAIPAG